MFYFMNIVRSFMNYAICCELCDRMRFEVDCAKSHHRVIPEGLHETFMQQLITESADQWQRREGGKIETIAK